MPRIRNVGTVRPLPFFIRASSFITGNGTGTQNVLKWNRALGLVVDNKLKIVLGVVMLV